jgi:hypothetical protein
VSLLPPLRRRARLWGGLRAQQLKRGGEHIESSAATTQNYSVNGGLLPSLLGETNSWRSENVAQNPRARAHVPPPLIKTKPTPEHIVKH